MGVAWLGWGHSIPALVPAQAGLTRLVTGSLSGLIHVDGSRVKAQDLLVKLSSLKLDSR